jgi:hypothetical protein
MRVPELPTDATRHWAPSSFDLAGDFTFVPHPWDAHWPLLERTLHEARPSAVLSLLPATLGMGPIFLNALQCTKTLGMTVALGNPDAASELLRLSGADFLVATPSAALKFFAENPKAALSIRHLYLVVDDTTVDVPVPYKMNVIRDLHEMPAVSRAI